MKTLSAIFLIVIFSLPSFAQWDKYPRPDEGSY
jgi:hypothetical protein